MCQPTEDSRREAAFSFDVPCIGCLQVSIWTCNSIVHILLGDLAWINLPIIALTWTQKEFFQLIIWQMPVYCARRLIPVMVRTYLSSLFHQLLPVWFWTSQFTYSKTEFLELWIAEYRKLWWCLQSAFLDNREFLILLASCFYGIFMYYRFNCSLNFELTSILTLTFWRQGCVISYFIVTLCNA